MTDLTLEDLAGVGGDDSGSSDGGSGGGEWVGNVIEKLDEKGLLDKLAENYMQNQMGGQQQAAPEQPGSPARSDGGEQDVDAEKVKGMMLQLYDNSSMIPGLSEDPSLSELIELLDSHEDMANELIRRHL